MRNIFIVNIRNNNYQLIIVFKKNKNSIIYKIKNELKVHNKRKQMDLM
jgi:hypothetical protein